MSVNRLQPQFVEAFPAAMKPGILYVSLEYRTCGHLCACGCGHEVTTPLSPAQWAFTFDGEDISLWPSVGNWSLPCRSHYVVGGGRVRWARTFSEAEIHRNRRRDRAALSAAGSSSARRPVDKPSVADTRPIATAARWRDQVRARVEAGVATLRRR